MVETKVKNWTWVNFKISREVWKQAKIQATMTDKRLSAWIAEAIMEKLGREKGDLK